MDEYEEWVGALSGKIKSISTDGVVELEGSGLQVFEKKKKEPKPTESTAAWGLAKIERSRVRLASGEQLKQAEIIHFSFPSHYLGTFRSVSRAEETGCQKM